MGRRMMEHFKASYFRILRSLRQRLTKVQGLVNHPAALCHKLKDNVDMDEAALLEPLSVAVHALKRSRIPSQADCLVFGAGTIGLLISALCINAGARSVLTVDIDAGRIRFALENHFTTQGYVIPLNANDKTMQAADKLKESIQLAEVLKEQAGISERGGFDRSFDCTGAESCVQTAIYATISGGMVMPIGMGVPEMYLPLSHAAFREVDIVGVFRYANDYPTSVDILESKKIPSLGKLITHRYYGLDKTFDALDMAGKTRDQDGKLVVKVLINATDKDSTASNTVL